MEFSAGGSVSSYNRLPPFTRNSGRKVLKILVGKFIVGKQELAFHVHSEAEKSVKGGLNLN